MDHQINRQPNKKDYYQKQPKIRWSHELNKWLCFDTKLNDQILSSKNFLVHSLDISPVEEKFKIDLSISKQVIEKLPLAHEGDKHKQLRKTFTNRINAKQEVGITNFENDLMTLWDFNEVGCEYDLVPGLHQAAIKFNAYISQVTGVDQIDKIDAIGQIFDEHTSVRKRIFINDIFKLLYENLSNDISHDEKIYRLALFTVGINALLGTLSESLLYCLKRQLSSLDPYENWATELPSTGLVFVERVAQNDVTIENVEIKKNNRVRCYIESTTHTSDYVVGYLPRFFGFPSNHICPGMKASVSLWQIVIRTLIKKKVKLNLENYNYRTNDQLFNYPISIKVIPK